MIAQRDPVEHLRRRKPWNRAFNTASLKAYEPALASRVKQMVGILRNQIGVTDLAQWINFFRCVIRLYVTTCSVTPT